jgi:Protein of unknown function (DUF1488)
MTLTFPNPSRSFDQAHNVVRFTGYDGVFQVPFVVEAAALTASDGKALLEAECLTAFDASRDLILDVARRAYSNKRRSSYTLTAADF